MSVLAVASQAAQAHRDVLIDGRKIPLSLWMLTVAESGERKSAVDSVALTPLAVHQKALIEKNEIDRAIYERDLQIWKREKERALGGKGKIAPDRKAMQDALDAIGPEPEPPLLPFLKVNDLTYEGIYKALAAGQPSIALISDEAGQFVGGHAMNPENLLKTVSGLSKLWDGGELSRVRAGDGASILYGRRLAMHLMMQPVVAELLFSNPLTAGQGFLARVLAAWPESNVGRQVYQERDLSLDPAVATYNETIKSLLEMEPPLADGKYNELAPAGLTLAPDAKRLYIQYHDTINRQAAAGEPLAPIRAFALKIHDQALRIAGVLTLVASPRANQISLDTLADAIKLTDWFLNEQLR
ncbi:MAG: DUF3987 domain-containing protein, partial [Candidatus Competibacteraceae bacterium]|nr:DUF3987 domain-containing protein [Candidatus Competibacteraceae bacterium]